MPEVFEEKKPSIKNIPDKIRGADNNEKKIHRQDVDLICKPKLSFWQKVKQPLRAYISNPVGFHFESQEDEEQIVLLLRQHPITNLPWILGGITMLLAPIFVFPIFSFLNPLPNMPFSFSFVFTIFWYCLTFSMVFVNYLHWFFNVYLVTNERIVDIDFNNLVHRELSSTRVSKVQDVTYKVSGVIRSIFDYGDVFVQTAGTEENFDFEAVPRPQLVVKKIGELIEKKEESQNNHTGV